MGAHAPAPIYLHPPPNLAPFLLSRKAVPTWAKRSPYARNSSRCPCTPSAYSVLSTEWHCLNSARSPTSKAMRL
eukprot:242894-Chlamydomonas_euryale.AAC.1